ncbi:hypothetical protein HK096_008173, partial [Nowakowskiella sp. JEL0078]
MKEFKRILLVSAACSDLAGKTLTQTQCYESITCAAAPYTYTGTFCGGLSTFSHTTTYYDCFPRPTSAVTTTSSCIVTLYTANLCTGIIDYRTTTLLDYGYPFYTTSAGVSTSCYANSPVYFATAFIWKTGVYAGISGVATTTRTTTTSSTFSSTIQTLSVDNVTSSPANDTSNVQSNNTVLVVVAVGVALIVVIAAVVGFVIVRKIRATPKNDSTVPSSPPSSYPPASDLQQRYPSGVPSNYMPVVDSQQRYPSGVPSNFIFYSPVPNHAQPPAQVYSEDIARAIPPANPPSFLPDQGQSQGQAQGHQPVHPVYFSPNLANVVPPHMAVQ